MTENLDGLNEVLMSGTISKISTALTEKGSLGATISIQSSYKDAFGAPKTFNEKVTINFTKKVAQNALNELSDGDFVFIRGSMGTVNYEKDGQKKSFTVVRVWDYTILVKGACGSQTVPVSAVSQADTFDDVPF